MSLYEDWVKQAYTKEGTSNKPLWDEYIPLEQKIYEGLIETKTTTINGTPLTLAAKYNMNAAFICGFLDGINDALLTPVDTETLEEDQMLDLTLDFEKLFKKMVEYKAEHLYTLPQWETLYTPEKQKEMYLEQKKSGTLVKAPTPSRNDPCPCNSGKKYKKCCGIA